MSTFQKYTNKLCLHVNIFESRIKSTSHRFLPTRLLADFLIWTQVGKTNILSNFLQLFIDKDLWEEYSFPPALEKENIFISPHSLIFILKFFLFQQVSSTRIILNFALWSYTYSDYLWLCSHWRKLKVSIALVNTFNSPL